MVKVMVPLLLIFPATVKVLMPIEKIDPELTVTPAHVAFAPSETKFAPVVAMTARSVVAGTAPPTQVPPVAQFPPVAVLVLVAAFNNVTVCNNAINKTNLYVVP